MTRPLDLLCWYAYVLDDTNVTVAAELATTAETVPQP